MELVAHVYKVIIMWELVYVKPVLFSVIVVQQQDVFHVIHLISDLLMELFVLV